MSNSKNKTAKIYIDGYAWFFQRIDFTHVEMSNVPISGKDRNGFNVLHIGQLKHQPYAEDVEFWLHDKKDIEGNSYETEFNRR